MLQARRRRLLYQLWPKYVRENDSYFDSCCDGDGVFHDGWNDANDRWKLILSVNFACDFWHGSVLRHQQHPMQRRPKVDDHGDRTHLLVFGGDGVESRRLQDRLWRLRLGDGGGEVSDRASRRCVLCE